jgi:hypothetical protein
MALRNARGAACQALQKAAAAVLAVIPEKNSDRSDDSRGIPRFSERLWLNNSGKCWLIFAVISL